MGERQHWKMFIESTKQKAALHSTRARYWDMITKGAKIASMGLTSVTTLLVLSPVPLFVTALVAGCSAFVSAMVGYMQPKTKREVYMAANKDFKTLMTRMIRCGSDKEYEKLWSEYDKCVLKEPFLPKSQIKKLPLVKFEYASNQLTKIMDKKDVLLADMEVRMKEMDRKDAERAEKEKQKEEERKKEREKRKEELREWDEKEKREHEEEAEEADEEEMHVEDTDDKTPLIEG